MERVNRNNIILEYPFNHDCILLQEKGLYDEGFSDEFFELYNKYKEMFSNFVKANLPIASIENGYQIAVFHFSPVKASDMDFYQRTDRMGFEYIYLRNNYYIENLPSADIEHLKTCEIDDYAFIERTFRMVIDKYPKQENTKTFVMYGPDSAKFLCNSEDIVFGIRYDEFAENGLDDETWQNNFFEQLKFTAQMTGIMEIAFEPRINNPVRAIQYNEVSILRKYDSCYDQPFPW